MTPRRLFLSSVQKEFAPERAALRDWRRGDSLMQRFADRLEVWKPGRLPESLTLAMFREPHGSVPGNPLLAEPLYLTQYIERMGTGTRDMIRRCEHAGLPGPEFAVRDGFVTTIRRVAGLAARVTPPVTPPVAVLVRLLGAAGELGSAEIRQHLRLRDRTHVRDRYLNPCLKEGWIETTIPEKPRSRLQTYRLTAQGRELLKTLADEKGLPP